MRPQPDTVSIPPPRVFKHSLDWRFLLPLTDFQKGLFLFEENGDFREALEQAGIHSSQQLSFADLQPRKNGRFPLLVLPFGVPVSWVSPSPGDKVEFYNFIRQFIDPGGTLLLGFYNQTNRLAWRATQYYPSTPPRVVRELHQAGYQSLKIFGAMPGLEIPEYIFDLEPRTIHFALQNRFRRKPSVLRILRVLSGTVGMHRISNFLPSYFALATA